jgi:hypothetical protein
MVEMQHRDLTRALATLSCICLLGSLLHAGRKNFEDGKVFHIEPLHFSLPVPVQGRGAIDLGTDAGYLLEIRQNGVFFVGFCAIDRCKLEWHAGSDVQYRLKRDSIYLKRSNGKQLKLTFVLQGTVDADGRTVVTRRARSFRVN